MSVMVLALHAAPVAAADDVAPAAPAAPPIPTVDKVLEASGITASGYLDAAYGHANRNIEAPAFSDRVFDSQDDSVTLHQAGVQIARQPAEGFGGLLNVTAGTDVPIFAAYPFTGGSGQFDLTQAFGQYASGRWTTIVGKYTSLQGSEFIWAPTNAYYSRSILFGAVPFTHTGVRTTYALNEAVSLCGGVNNGWDQVSSASRGRTLELGLCLHPIKPLTATISDYLGKASSVTGGANLRDGPTGTRNSLDLVGTYAVTDAASLGLEYLYLTQDNFTALVPAATGIQAHYDGTALYGSYLFTPNWRLAVRGEFFRDPDGFHFGTRGTNYREGTTALSWLPGDHVEVRAEIRCDRASNAVFSDLDAQGRGRSLLTYALEGLFKF